MSDSHPSSSPRSAAFQLIILLGVVSMLGDITYEGARSITGPYLALLGASAAAVGFVSGLGEFLGYALRLVSGYVADVSKRYWLFTFLGYGLILSVPLLGLTSNWEVAAVLIILERAGKAVRSPARDAILSHATRQVGRGLGFGIHEAMDQLGALLGPIMFSVILFLHGSYREGFLILFVPALLVLVMLVIARAKTPEPHLLEEAKAGTQETENAGRLSPTFWLYTLFTAIAVAGFANFQLISYHFKVQKVIGDAYIPLLYALAMGVDGVVALLIGKFYDVKGIKALFFVPFLSIPIPFLAFSHSFALAVASIILWGAVLGMQETIMRAAIADLTPIERRGAAYGIFKTVYGAAWFLGSGAMGLLYDLHPSLIPLFVIILEIVALPVLLAAVRKD